MLFRSTSLLVDSIATLGDRAVLAIEELWDTRGIAGDARVLKDIEPGAALSTPRNLTELGGRALFVANTSASGFEPWVTDGTQDGTMLLGDLWPGTGGSRVQGIVVADDAAFVEADTGVVNGLWLTRGTPATTRQIPLPRGVTEVDQVVGAAADQVTVLARTAEHLVV